MSDNPSGAFGALSRITANIPPLCSASSPSTPAKSHDNTAQPSHNLVDMPSSSCDIGLSAREMFDMYTEGSGHPLVASPSSANSWDAAVSTSCDHIDLSNSPSTHRSAFGSPNVQVLQHFATGRGNPNLTLVDPEEETQEGNEMSSLGMKAFPTVGSTLHSQVLEAPKMRITDVSSNRSTTQAPPAVIELQPRMYPRLESLQEVKWILPPLSVKEQIKERVRPHTARKTRPPFTPAQLVVMAIVVGGQDSSTQDIFKWIITTFKHYLNTVTSHIAEGEFGIPDEWNHYGQNKMHKFKSGIAQALMDHDTPVTWNTSTSKWHISHSEARAFLGLEEVPGLRRGTFNFMKLPPEIRQRIYSLLVVFDGSGIRFETRASRHSSSQGGTPSGSLHTLANQDRPTFSFGDHWEEPLTSGSECHRTLASHGYRVLPKRSSLLAITRVNKQISREAVSTFVGQNLWYFSDVYALDAFLETLPASRMKYVEKVALVYNVAARPFGLHDLKQTATAAFRTLCALPNLKKVHIRIDEPDVLAGFKNVSNSTGFHAGKIPGFEYLKDVHTINDMVFVGDCNRIREQMNASMNPKPAVEGTAAASKPSTARGRKAKRGLNDEAGESGNAKKVKIG